MTTSIALQTVTGKGVSLTGLFLTAALLLLAAASAAGSIGRDTDLSASDSGRGRGQAMENSYRGYHIEPFGAGVSAPELELAAATPQALRLAINTLLYRAETGIVAPETEARYAAADLDRDGILTGPEADKFADAARQTPGVSLEELLCFWGR